MLHRGAFSRRDFLRSIGAAGTSTALATLGCSGPEIGGATDGRDLIVRQADPYNAEPALERLVRSWVTPTPSFFVRGHAPAPQIDPAKFSLRIEGMVDRPLRLTLDQLGGDFGHASVTAILQCAGNRREEHSRIRKVGGVQWGAGAIGNAEWTGVRLADVLKKAGVQGQASHVHFTGLDQIPRKGGIIPFGGSIPIEKALRSESLIALTMNGSPLTPDHGFPARMVVPGFIGARSVKWVGTITVSDDTSSNHYLRRAYKVFPPEVNSENVKWDQAEPLYQMPLNSVICIPGSDHAVRPGLVQVQGYASPPGQVNRTVSRVEVSTDSGKTWTQARITTPQKPFVWCLWRANVSLKAGPATLTVRAWDSAGAGQPEKVPWNFKGYFFNAWHRVSFSVRSGG